MTFGALARRFDETMCRARARSAALGAAADELTGQLGHARSADAEAVVDGGGALVSLWLAESATRLSPERVAALIVDTVTAAASDARRRRRQVLAELATEFGR